MFVIVVLLLLVFLFKGGGFGFSRPNANALGVISFQNETLTPEMFLTDVRNGKADAVLVEEQTLKDAKKNEAGSMVHARFVSEVNTAEPGESEVEIRLQNARGNKRTLTAQLRILAGSSRILLDKGTGLDQVSAARFLRDPADAGAASLSLISDVPVYDAENGCYFYPYSLRIYGQEISCSAGVFDVTPPEILGAGDKEISVNDTVQYRSGVTVTDDFDPAVKLEIDASAVNASEVGVYPVVYRATDQSGNEASVTIELKVITAEMQQVIELEDEVLGQIITEGMSQREKAHAIYRWIYDNIRYTAAPEDQTLWEDAYYGLSRSRGNCYTIAALSEAMLTRVEIPNMRIWRIPGADVIHVWNLVKIDGGWYHFDACPTYLPYDGFLFTDSKSREYSEMLSPYRLHYYDYVKEEYPAVVE
ncbi:hypothetical protein AGMMS49983_07500 [Clostridia bacterium]|nr:hypothetical protein AGMMS49983_07500 [Clostridia bacterium]